MHEELNAKLQEWSGDPTYSVYTESLDTCFHRLVPKLEYYFSYQFNETLLKDNNRRWRCLLVNKGFGKEKFESFGATPAQSFCLAIEKLIDGGD